MTRIFSFLVFIASVCGFQQINYFPRKKTDYPHFSKRIIPLFCQNDTYHPLTPSLNDKMIVLDTLRVLNKSLHDEQKKNEKFAFEQNIKENFKTIGGYNDIKEELLQIKDILQNYKKYEKYNIRTPKGILLEGPPGNGKTLLAKCFAGECGFHFIAVSGAEFNEKYVGVGAARVREIFHKAQENQPCIIFIDELDAIGGKRIYNDEGSVVERFQTLNQLLVLMDGFSSDKMQHVFIIGATNQRDILDKALLRSGRFDKIVHVPNPDRKTRIEIIEIHRKNKPIDKNIDSTAIADITNGLSGADIENILNEACLVALRKNGIVDNLEMIEDVRDKLMIGVSSTKKEISVMTKKRIAVHESGHLLVGFMSSLHENPVRVTIESTGINSLGYTFFDHHQMNQEGIFSKEYLQQKIMTLLAGRIAEELIYGNEPSTGSVDDMNRVKILASKMVTEHGMTNKPLFSFQSERQKELMDKQIQKQVEECYEKTKKLLKRNDDLLVWFSNELFIKKTMNETEILFTMERGFNLFPSTDITN